MLGREKSQVLLENRRGKQKLETDIAKQKVDQQKLSKSPARVMGSSTHWDILMGYECGWGLASITNEKRLSRVMETKWIVLKKKKDPNGFTGAKPTSPNHSLISNSSALSVFPRKIALASQSKIFWSTPMRLFATQTFSISQRWGNLHFPHPFPPCAYKSLLFCTAPWCSFLLASWGAVQFMNQPIKP